MCSNEYRLAVHYCNQVKIVSTVSKYLMKLSSRVCSQSCAGAVVAHWLVSMMCGMTNVYLRRPVVAGIDICHGVCIYPY